MTSPFRDARVLSVIDLGDDPSTVVVTDGSDEGPQTIPCLASYSPRTVGDEVLVVRLAGGAWLALGAIGSAATSITYSSAAPSGGGWLTGGTTYVRVNADGSRSLHINTGGSVPMPAVVPAVGAGGWLSNTTITSTIPRVGAADEFSGDWYGAWFYGGGIAAACAGKTVASMKVRIARTDGGRNGSTVLRLGLHNQTAGPVLITNDWVPGAYLNRGGAASITIPAEQAALLASGTAKGITVAGYGPLEYADFTTSADVTITFA